MLAKKLMLDWTQDNLAETFNFAFYLSCKGLNHRGTCLLQRVSRP